MYLLLLLCAAIAFLAHATSGWSVWTAEGVRKQRFLHEGYRLPAVQLQLANGEPADLRALSRGLLLLEFVYTRCPTVCNAMSAEFLQRQLREESRSMIATANGSENDNGSPSLPLRLLSVSFDQNHDTPLALRGYLQRFGAKPGIWQAARFTKPQQQQGLLNDLGVVVIDDGNGEFTHNAGIYLLVDGWVRGLYSLNETDALDAAILAIRSSEALHK